MLVEDSRLVTAGLCQPSYTGLLVSCVGAGVAMAIARMAVTIAIPAYG